MISRSLKYKMLRYALSVLMVSPLVLIRTSGSSEVKKPSEPVNIGMLALLATPQKYDEQVIRTIGYLSLRSNDNALFFHEEDVQIPLLKDSFALDLDLDQEKEFKALNLTYVMVQGTLRSRGADGPALNSGTITHITMVHGWKPYVPFDQIKR